MSGTLDSLKRYDVYLEIWRGGNYLDLYFIGGRLKFQPEHHLSLGFCDFIQSLKANAGMVLWSRSFPVHHSSLVLLANATDTDV
jgi:hypothetical protein